MRVSALALALGACSFSAYPMNQPPEPDGSPAVDAAIDSGSVGAGAVCIGRYIQVCIAPPSQTLTLNARKIDTSQDSLCLPYMATPAVDACVIAGQSITIPPNNTVTVTGSKRLILLSTTSITISGVLDASSTRMSSGPAADAGPCLTSFTPPQTGIQGGGGWGGALGGGGSNGGTSAGGGIGGIAAAQGNVLALGGGCPGGSGADGELGGAGGAAGRGGGAVLLIAQQALLINGTVNASGAGGGGGGGFLAAGGGGGGGGSGGMIVLDAGSVNIPGRCFANGGGGGEGASAFSGRDGHESGAPDSSGNGGDHGGPFGGGPGGAGGFGATRSSGGGNGSSATAVQGGPGGGGGGGGGVGVIKVFSTSPPQNTGDLHKVSPVPSINS